MKKFNNTVLIDTSTFYSANKANFDHVSNLSLLSSQTKSEGNRKNIWESAKQTFWENKAIGLSVWHILESTIIYDQITVDAESVKINDEAIAIIKKLQGVVKLVDVPKEDYTSIHGKTLKAFQKIASEGNSIDLISETELNLVLGHFERDLDKIKLRDGINRYFDGDWNRFYSISIDNKSDSISKVLETLLSLRWSVNDKHLRRYLKEMDSNPMGLWPMFKVYLNFFRILFYYNLAEFLGINYCPHPLRNEVWSNKKFVPLIAKDIVAYFEKRVRRQAVEVSKEVFPSLNVDIRVPTLYKYILKGVSCVDDLFMKALELREKKEVRRFREFCSNVETAYRVGNYKEFQNTVMQLRRAADEWADSISAKKTTKRLTIKDPFGIVSAEIEVPDRNLAKSHRGPLVFIQNLMDVI